MKKTVALIALLSSVGCSDSGTAAPVVDYSALLRDVSEQVAFPSFQAAATKADALLVALKTLEADGTSVQNAQTAWREARSAYRRLDTFSFGPVISLGIDLRIDAAPADVNGIDASVAGTDELTTDYVGRLGGKKKGWLALEHLLFGPGNDALTAGSRRLVLARLIGEEVAASLHQLVDGWDPAKQGRAQDLSEAGQGGYYSTQLLALDDLVGGGAYALEVIVGERLAQPLGRKSQSPGPDPSQDYTLASDSAVADMIATLEGVQAVYASPGFTTFVRPKVQNLDDKAVAQLNDCNAKISAIPKPFGTAVVQNTAAVQQAFDSCKDLKLTWNTDLTSTLGASLKPLDSDGD